MASYGAAPEPLYSAAYASLVNQGAYTGGGSPTYININNLTIGQHYQVQVIEAFWNTNWQTIYTAGNSVAVNLAGPQPVGSVPSTFVPQTALGFFIANSTSEIITLSSLTNYVVPDAISVSAVPELSTWVMMLAGFAGLGFVGYRRNKGRVCACLTGISNRQAEGRSEAAFFVSGTVA